MATLEDALRIALVAHEGQTDKAGQPYLLHPLRVMRALETEAEKIVGLLHDVLEDSNVSTEDLKAAGFSEEIVEAVECLTRREDESYEEFIRRAKANPLARRVKIADLEDNLDLTRIPDPGPEDWERVKRYHKARQHLLSE